MAKDSLDLDTESEDDRNKDNYTNEVTNKEASYKYRINGYSSSTDSSGNDQGNTHALIGNEDKVSNSSLNSDSSDTENTSEVFHAEIIKRSLLNGPNFRRLSSPAVLGNRESPKQEYYTLQDYLNKNYCVRGNSISSPHPADAESGMMMMNYMMSSKRSSTDQEDPKEKRLQKVRLFFIEHCVYKLILCLPFGFLATISILGLKGDPIIFVCYIIIFTLVVFYPFSCLLWLLYKILLPYYQMCRYTPNAGTEKSSEKNEDDTEYNIPTIVTEKPTEPTKSLSQTVYERRRSLPARRPSCLPAIEEDETTNDDSEDNEENEDSSEKKDNLDHQEEKIKL